MLTRPQVRLPDAEQRLEAARQAPLPEGPIAWPVPPGMEESDDELDELSEAITAKADEEA